MSARERLEHTGRRGAPFLWRHSCLGVAAAAVLIQVRLVREAAARGPARVEEHRCAVPEAQVGRLVPRRVDARLGAALGRQRVVRLMETGTEAQAREAQDSRRPLG